MNTTFTTSERDQYERNVLRAVVEMPRVTVNDVIARLAAYMHAMWLFDHPES